MTYATRSGQPHTQSLLENFGQEISRFFDRYADDDVANSRFFAPRLNIAETDQAYEVAVDLPGLKADDFHIEFKDGQLWISGERKHEAEQKGKTYHRVERSYGQFRRVIALGTDIDVDHVDASYNSGVLQVTVPKIAAVQPRRIPVKS